jgi:RNA polymerase sigma factor, sigma-70 family
MRLPEEEVWYNFRQGDIGSFEWIYDQYAKLLFQYCKQYCNSQALVEDCIQELFTELWEKRANLGPTTSIKFYLLSSIRRKLARKLQQENKRHLFEGANELPAFQTIATPESILILSEEEKLLQATLLQAVNELPVRQREVLYLRYFQGLSFEEIAEITSLPRKTTYNIMYLALDTLRKKLSITSDIGFMTLLVSVLSRS